MGSEMCIRDRYTPVLGYCVERMGQQERGTLVDRGGGRTGAQVMKAPVGSVSGRAENGHS